MHFPTVHRPFQRPVSTPHTLLWALQVYQCQVGGCLITTSSVSRVDISLIELPSEDPVVVDKMTSTVQTLVLSMHVLDIKI